MNSINMIYFEHNMSMIEIEREYMRNMINLEYRGGVLNEDTEVVYEGVFETIKNAISAIFEKIRKLFESVINFFKKTKDNAKNKEDEEIIKKTEEILNNVDQNKKIELNNDNKIYFKPLSFVCEENLAREDAYKFTEVTGDLSNFCSLILDGATIEKCYDTKNKIMKKCNDIGTEHIDFINGNLEDMGVEPYHNKINPIYKDDEFFTFIKKAFRSNIFVKRSYRKIDVQGMLDQTISYYKIIANDSPYVNKLHSYIAKIRGIQKSIYNITYNEKEEEIIKMWGVYKNTSTIAIEFFQFMLKSYTMLINFDKINIRHNIRTCFQLSKIAISDEEYAAIMKKIDDRFEFK